MLTQEAKWVLARKKPYIIAVTGNLGKTSTKDAIYFAIKDTVSTRRSEKSFNSEWGVPLTILGEKSGLNSPIAWLLILFRGLFASFDDHYPQYLVLEVGADRPHDIKKITEYIKPDIAVVTQFGQIPVHIEFFKDRDAIIEEKGYLVEALKKDGLLLWNKDDVDIREKIIQKTDAQKMSFALHELADIQAVDVKEYGNPLVGMKAHVLHEEKTYDVFIQHVLGKAPVYATLPALLVASHLAIPFEIAIPALARMEPAKGRMRLLSGMNESTIIDDSYNASPKAMEHGLHTVAHLSCTGKKRVVLGDMFELGSQSRDAHYAMGKIAGVSADVLYATGIRALAIAEGALDAGMQEAHIFECDTALDAGKQLVQDIEKGDIVYVKGSQGMRMEMAVKMILESTHDPRTLLVRQEKEWE